MEDFESLELLSLVAKVTSELQNHLGMSDKDLAEFLIAEHGKCKTFDDFQTQMKEYELPGSLLESIDRLIITMHPRYKKSANMDKSQHLDGKARVLKGLAIRTGL